MLPKISPLNTKQKIRIILSILVFLILIELINIFTNRSLIQYGIVPRQISSLPGILVAPFIHGSIMHLFSNILPLAVLGFLLLLHGTGRFILVNLWVIVVGGGLVWIFGRNAVHVGASGVVYGYFAYLLVAGFLAKQFKLLVISLFVMVAYGGLVWGVLPGSPYVSWESHLFGAAAGCLAAFIWARKK